MVHPPYDTKGLVAESESWRAGAAAIALSRKWSWAASSAGCMQLLFDSITKNRADANTLTGWVFNAVRGLVALKASPEVDRQNLAAMLSDVMQHPMMTPMRLSAVVQGARIAAPNEFADSWKKALLQVHRAMMHTRDWQAASDELRFQTSALSDEDRFAAIATILRRHR